eukprot:TRINITY_DN3788_c0_g1_i4.p1 TRINITY_DN3788_c0_g1~~TRINITY_DN3788_c0_g1_i4.p1  ORF type:complete len:528 (+),score=84.47 TRINITY_DN3788_c0_g1_i4:68-1651(+)
MVHFPQVVDQRRMSIDGPGPDATSSQRPSTSSIPWWGYIAAAFVLMNMVSMGRVPQINVASEEQQHSSAVGLRGGLQRRLDEQMVIDITDGGDAPHTGHISAGEGINVSVPCLGWYAYKSDHHNIGYGGLLSPCGTILVGPDGQDIAHPFGSFHIPGKDGLHAWAESVDQSFAHWIWAAFVFLLVSDIVWHAVFYFYPAIQPDFFDEINDLLAGRLSPPDSFLTPEEVADWKAARMEYDSGDFVARGNIFRVLAVFEPRDPNVGWYRWSQYVIRGVLCAWMQLYLPYSMISEILGAWTFRGPKSIFWLSANFGQFLVMFVALGELASVFFGMAKKNFIKGAKANNFILSHHNPYRGAKAYSEVEARSPKSPNVEASPSERRALTLVERPDWALGDKLFRVQQYFWCILSMMINFSMSLLLPLVFLLRAATYTGDISSIAIELTSLYFVFDLDTKIMESDSGLEVRFRYVIKRQKAMGLRPENEHPTLMRRIVGFTQLCLDFSIKYLLLFALATAWEGQGQVIGGSPF